MALINCPECKKEISDMAKICPNCGYPISSQTTQPVVTNPCETSASSQQQTNEQKSKNLNIGCLVSILVPVFFIFILVLAALISPPSGGSDLEGPHSKAEAMTVAKLAIQERLKNPSSAKYGSWKIEYNGNNKYTVTGWVESTNSFGATVRNNFIVTYTATSSGGKNVSVSLR